MRMRINDMKAYFQNLKLKMILWNQKNIWRIPVILLGLLFILISILTGSFIYQSNKISVFTEHEKAHSAVILNNLQVIDNQLKSLSDHAQDSKDITANMMTIKNEIDLLKNNILTKIDFSKLSTQMTSFQQDLDSQLSSMQKNIAGGINKTYLDPNVLPFKIISIDVISGQPFITVDYEHHQSAFQIGDSLVNWKIMTADYQDRTVEFQNDKGQLVKVTLQD